MNNLRLLPAPTTCRCPGCEGLADRYADDPDLLAYYRRQLLRRGWADQVDAVEREYQRAHATWFRTTTLSESLAGELAPAAKDGKCASLGPAQLPLALAEVVR